MGVAAHKQAYSLATCLPWTCVAPEATTNSTAVVAPKFELAAAKHALALAAAVAALAAPLAAALVAGHYY